MNTDKTLKLVTVISHLVVSLAAIGALTYLAASGVLDLSEFSDVIAVLLGAIGGFGLRYRKTGNPGGAVDSLPLMLLAPILEVLQRVKG